MTENLDNVFVYGTLKVGGYFSYNSVFNENRVCTRVGYIRARLYDLGNFPGIKLSRYKKDVVHGEIHRYKNIENVLERMDWIEGYNAEKEGGLFVRKTVIAHELFHSPKVKGEREVYVYVYEFNENIKKYTHVKSGLWEV